MKKEKERTDAKPLTDRSLRFDAIIEAIFLIIIFTIPLIFDRRLGIVFSGTKVTWLRTLVIIIMSLWSAKILLTREYRFFRTPLDWPVLTYLLSATVATLTSVHVYISFAGFYGRYEGLSTWYLYGLLFFILTNYFRSFHQIRKIVLMTLPTAAIMSLYSIIQRQELDPYMWGGVVTWQRVIGTIGQPNFLAAYMLMAFFLLLFLFLEKEDSPEAIDWNLQWLPLTYFSVSLLGFIFMIYMLEAPDVILWYSGWALISAAALLFVYSYDDLHIMVKRIIAGLTMILVYISILYTQSRGGYMGLSAGLVIFFLMAGRKVIFKEWKNLLLISMVIFLISAVTMLRPEYSPFQRFTAEISAKSTEADGDGGGSGLELKGAAGSRGETWKSAFKIIADYPFFGIGPETLKMIFPRYETELFRFKEAFHVKQDRCHNETFDVPVTKGLITFVIYLWILFTVFRSAFVKLKGATEKQGAMLACLMAAMVAYLVQNQFSFGVVAITSIFWVMWGMVMIIAKGDEAAPVSTSKIRSMPWIILAGLFLISAYLIYLSFLSFRADVFFKEGKSMLETRRTGDAVKELNDSLSVLPFEGITISHLAISYLNLNKPQEAIDVLRYGIQVDPYNADNFHMFSKLMISLYDRGMKEALPEAKKDAQIAIAIDPYYAEAYESLGMIYEREGKMDAALEKYEKAFQVNPTLASVIQKIEVTSRKLGKIERAQVIFEKAYNRFPDNVELFKAMERTKK